MLLNDGCLASDEMKGPGGIGLFLETEDLLFNRRFMAQSIPGVLTYPTVMDQTFNRESTELRFIGIKPSGVARFKLRPRSCFEKENFTRQATSGNCELLQESFINEINMTTALMN